MKISFKKYPADIILCMIWSIILLPLVFLDIESILRVLVGLPFIIFIPGYILIFALFPAKQTKKAKNGIDSVERVALSFGLSIAIVPLIGLLVNYTTPWGIQIEPILISIFIFIIGVGAIGINRWFKTSKSRRYIVSFELSLPKSETKLDKALTIILVITILLAAATFVYVLVSPKRIEHFTEFYLLGPDGKTEGYPSMLALGEEAAIIVGINNQEYQTMNYTIEVWLINQSIVYNESENRNETVIHTMWFIDKITTTLDYVTVDLEHPWALQWQYNYSFVIERKGSFKLAFFLFTNPTENYSYDEDYSNIAEEKMSNAYRDTHLMIDTKFTEFSLLEPDDVSDEYPINIAIGENVTGTLGILNHEYRTIDYTIEAWLINESTYYNESEKINKTIIHNMWFVDKITTDPLPSAVDMWVPQWQYNYSFAINRTGSFKLAFLLYTTPTEGYIVDEDYIKRAEIKFKSAYMVSYLWLDVV